MMMSFSDSWNRHAIEPEPAGGQGSREEDCPLPVGDVAAAGELQVLQALQEGRSPRHAAVADAGTVAERQAGEAAAAAADCRQAGVAELRQHAQRQTLQLWEADHLGQETGSTN